jgi:hypothetical protein
MPGISINCFTVRGKWPFKRFRTCFAASSKRCARL